MSATIFGLLGAALVGIGLFGLLVRRDALLRILAFIDRPHGGTIFFDGKRANIDDSNLTRSVSMLLQEPYLLKRTVFENVAYGLKVRGERKRLKDKVDEALAMVGLDYREFARRSWYELSGGEAQRVKLAAELAKRSQRLPLLGDDDLTADRNYIREFVMTPSRELGRRFGMEYAEAFHYVGPGASGADRDPRVDAYVKKHVLPL